MPMVQLVDLTYLEMRQLADTGCLALVPTGCTEQQGPHLPVGFDMWLVSTVAQAAAESIADSDGLRVLVLPTLPELLPSLRARSSVRQFAFSAEALVDVLTDARLVLGGASPARSLGWTCRAPTGRSRRTSWSRRWSTSSSALGSRCNSARAPR